MINKLREVFDFDMCKVLAASTGGMGISFTAADQFLKLVIGVGTAIYIWKKVLHRKRVKAAPVPVKNADEEETDI